MIQSPQSLVVSQESQKLVRQNGYPRCSLRATFELSHAHAYGLTQDELRCILKPTDVKGLDYPSETFRVPKGKDIRHHGGYRTHCLVLAARDWIETCGEFTAMEM